MPSPRIQVFWMSDLEQSFGESNTFFETMENFWQSSEETSWFAR